MVKKRSAMENAVENEGLGQEMGLSQLDTQLIRLWAFFDSIRQETGGEALRTSGARIIHNNMRRINEVLEEIGSETPDPVVDLTSKARPECRRNRLSIEARLETTIDNLNELIREGPEQNRFAIKSHAEIGKNTVLEMLLGRLCR